MDGAGREVSPRFQFRLNLNVPEEAALYDELQSLPSGKRNGVIVARLLHAGGAAELTDAHIEAVKNAFRDVLAEYQFRRTIGPDSITAPSIPPDELFDTTPFSGGTHGSKKT